MNLMKYKFQQVAERPNVLQLYLYDEVKSDGESFWTGEKIRSETSAATFRDQLAQYPNAETIELYVNSMGGSVLEGYGIYGQLKRHAARKVAYIDGFAGSIASVIPMACDEIIMYRNSMMAIHNMMDLCFGNAAEHRKCADDLDKIMEGNRQIYLEKSGGKVDEAKLIAMLDAETWLTAAECLEYGFCTQVLSEDTDLTAANELMKQRTEITAYQVANFKALRQTVRELTAEVETTPAEPVQAPEQEPSTDPEQSTDPEVTQNKAASLMAALFKRKD